MPSEMTYAQGVLYVIVELAPSFLAVCTIFLLLSWVRLLIRELSADGF